MSTNDVNDVVKKAREDLHRLMASLHSALDKIEEHPDTVLERFREHIKNNICYRKNSCMYVDEIMDSVEGETPSFAVCERETLSITKSFYLETVRVCSRCFDRRPETCRGHGSSLVHKRRIGNISLRRQGGVCKFLEDYYEYVPEHLREPICEYSVTIKSIKEILAKNGFIGFDKMNTHLDSYIFDTFQEFVINLGNDEDDGFVMNIRVRQ